MFGPDPLGIGLRQRAREHTQRFQDTNRELGKQHGQLVSFSNLGPLSDPAWDAFKQAMYEQGVDKVGVDTGGSGYSPTFNPRTQQSAVLRGDGPAQRQGMTSGHMGSMALDGFGSAYSSYMSGGRRAQR